MHELWLMLNIWETEAEESSVWGGLHIIINSKNTNNDGGYEYNKLENTHNYAFQLVTCLQGANWITRAAYTRLGDAYLEHLEAEAGRSRIQGQPLLYSEF